MGRSVLAETVRASELVYDKQKDADSIISLIERNLQSIREIRSNDTVVKGKQAALLLSDNLELKFNLQGKRSGVTTGLHALDEITDGLQYGEQTIVGARPSQGKTALATSIVHHACIVNRVPTLVITLEMSIQALCRRILSKHTKISMNKLRNGAFSERDFGQFKTFSVLLANAPIYFMDSISGSDCNKVCAAIKRAVKIHGVKFVVIDYLQKIRPSERQEKRTYEVAEVSGALKAVAVQTGVAMLTLAQLNRESVKGKRPPTTADLKESGDLEQTAQNVILLHPDQQYLHTMLVHELYQSTR